MNHNKNTISIDMLRRLLTAIDDRIPYITAEGICLAACSKESNLIFLQLKLLLQYSVRKLWTRDGVTVALSRRFLFCIIQGQCRIFVYANVTPSCVQSFLTEYCINIINSRKIRLLSLAQDDKHILSAVIYGDPINY